MNSPSWAVRVHSAGEGDVSTSSPRLVVIKAVHDMLERGATDGQIAEFIRAHVKIVMISDEECLKLDRKDQLGLRQRMPIGWAFGDDIYARLSVAEIEWAPTGI
jgi:hypothetical protein